MSNRKQSPQAKTLARRAHLAKAFRDGMLPNELVQEARAKFRLSERQAQRLVRESLQEAALDMHEQLPYEPVRILMKLRDLAQKCEAEGKYRDSILALLGSAKYYASSWAFNPPTKQKPIKQPLEALPGELARLAKSYKKAKKAGLLPPAPDLENEIIQSVSTKEAQAADAPEEAVSLPSDLDPRRAV